MARPRSAFRSAVSDATSAPSKSRRRSGPSPQRETLCADCRGNLRRRDDDELVETIVVGMTIERFRDLAGETLLGDMVPVDLIDRAARRTDAGNGASRAIGALFPRCRIVLRQDLLDFSSFTSCAVPLLRRNSAFWPSPIRTSALWEMVGIDPLAITDASMPSQRTTRSEVASATAPGARMEPRPCLPVAEPKTVRRFEPEGSIQVRRKDS